jgi:hypothetical protein
MFMIAATFPADALAVALEESASISLIFLAEKMTARQNTIAINTVRTMCIASPQTRQSLAKL